MLLALMFGIVIGEILRKFGEASIRINTDPCWDDPYVDELMLACAADDHRIGCCHPDCKNGPEDPDWRRKRFFGRAG